MAYTCSVDEVIEAVEVTQGGKTGSGTRYGIAIRVGPLFTNSEYGEFSREKWPPLEAAEDIAIGIGPLFTNSEYGEFSREKWPPLEAAEADAGK